jgi:hypothetical protein
MNNFKELPWRLFAAIIALWLAVGILPSALSRNLHDASDFANTFGFVNALFAALAFGGVIWAIRLQTRELELQRQEIEETRDELRRAADAQQSSQQMHFLAALLSARDNVARGYAAAADRETGSLHPSAIAHRQQLAELEWLLQLVDKHPSNPFSLPTPSTLVAHQLVLLLNRSHAVLLQALACRAANHARTLMLDFNQALRQLRRLLTKEDAQDVELQIVLDRAIAQAETVSNACEFDEIAAIAVQVFNDLSDCVGPRMGTPLPRLTRSTAAAEA